MELGGRGVTPEGSVALQAAAGGMFVSFPSHVQPDQLKKEAMLTDGRKAATIFSEDGVIAKGK